jgi:hypothetical protein
VHATKIAIVAAFVAALGGISARRPLADASSADLVADPTSPIYALSTATLIRHPSITTSPSTRAASRWSPLKRPTASSTGALSFAAPPKDR